MPDAFLLTEAELRAIPDDHFAGGIPSQLWFGAFQRDQLVGYVVARRSCITRLAHTTDIGPLYVTDTAKRQGLGQSLMQQVMDACTDAGLLQVELSVDATNTAAIVLYTKLGFVPFGRRPRSVIVDGVPRTDLLMIRALNGTDLRAPA